MNYKVPENVLKATIGYLQRKPYEEVANLLAAYKEVKEIKEDKKVDPPVEGGKK